MFKASDNLLESLDFSRIKKNGLTGNIGIEKESIRVFKSYISQKPHRDFLGSPLYNKYITTDFADAQLELVTPPLSNSKQLLSFIDNLQHYVIHNIESEYLWPFSIPPKARKGSEILIAKFGKTNKAIFKEIYREGLANRYGKVMQSISGIHYNYSFNSLFWESFKSTPKELDSIKFRAEIYFRTLRNLQRFNWLLLYFFGCSPVIGEDLVDKKFKFMKNNFDEYYLPFATSIRMSPIGYQNTSQSNLFISLNDIDRYLKDLKKASETRSKKFTKFEKTSGAYCSQLNSNILQTEDEYYAIARPKSNADKDFRQISKLMKYGIDYIELRSLDLNPYVRYGIEEKDIIFLELFLLYCTLSKSPMIDKKELKQTRKNNNIVSFEGRKKNILLARNQNKISLQDWAHEILDGMEEISELFGNYELDIKSYREKANDPTLTLSGKFLDSILDQDIGFYNLADSLGRKYRTEYLTKNKANNIQWEEFVKETDQSISKEFENEKKEEVPFKDYLEKFLS